MDHNTLSVFNQDGLELVIDQKSGEVFASQSAIARMVGVDKSTVLRYFEGVAVITALKAQVMTAGGLQGVALYNEDAIFQAFAKYKPELLIQCAKAGVRLYLHHLAGYQFKAQTKPKSPAEMLLESAQQLVDHERRLEAIEQRAIDAENSLKELPPSSVEAEPLTTRFMIGRLVKLYAQSTNMGVGSCWNILYTEFRDRYHIDLKKRGKNHKPQLTGVEYAYHIEQIDNLYAVAKEIFTQIK